MGVAEVRFRQGEYRDCVRRCGAVVEQALAFNEEKELAAAYLLLHLVHSVLGSPERLSYRGLALPIFEELGDLRGQATVLNNLGIDAYYEGDWRKALDVYRRSRDLFDRIGDVTNVAMATNNIGEILSDQGHLDDAERLFEEVRLSVDAAGHRLLSAVARLNLGRVAARAGRPDEADALLLEAMQAFADIDAASFEQEAQARRAEAALVAGDAERALALADAAEFGGESDAPAALRALLHRIRGLAQARRGHDGKALAELEASVAHAREGDAAYELALSLRAIGELAGNAEAAADAERLLADLEAVLA
jgi:tetratricopeptide (TPR) repeat protein